jgi:hypothetical protein
MPSELGGAVPSGKALKAMVHEALTPLTDDRLDVAVFDVQRVLRCPGARSEQDYRDTALMARRRIGLHALSLMQQSPRPITPLQAVKQALEDPPDSLEPWVLGLDDGGRTAVARDALVLVHGLRTQLRWPTRSSIGHQPLNAVAGAVNLKARVDGFAHQRTRDRADQQLLLTNVHAPDPAVERVTAAFTAMVYGLMYGVPARTVHVRCVATGTATRHDIGADAIFRAISAASTTAAALLNMVEERRAGAHCRHCTKQHTCSAARAWQRDGVRIGGIRVGPDTAVGGTAGPAGA